MPHQSEYKNLSIQRGFLLNTFPVHSTFGNTPFQAGRAHRWSAWKFRNHRICVRTACTGSATLHGPSAADRNGAAEWEGSAAHNAPVPAV